MAYGQNTSALLCTSTAGDYSRTLAHTGVLSRGDRLLPWREADYDRGMNHEPVGPVNGDVGLLALVREARPHLVRTGADTEAWLGRLEEQHDGLHDLMERLLAADPQTASEAASRAQVPS